MRGLFFTIDGGDGAGKSTQVARLRQWLVEQGHQVVVCRDPGSTPLGEAVRTILLHRHDLAIHRRAEMLLYMAARAQLVEEVIRPALDRGDTVLSDRFLLANVVYQGYGGGLEVESLWEIGRVATAGVMPELTIVLDIAPAVAAARLARSLDRMERQGDEFHQRVRQGFLAEAARQPDRIVVVDAAPAAEEVHAAVRAAVERFLQTRHPPCVLPPNKPAKPAR